MAKTNERSTGAVQSTFTKQKRELEKANSLIRNLRAQEKRNQRYDVDGKLEQDERETYLVDAPEAIVDQVLQIVAEAVRQHGARQRANGVNTGHFDFCGVEAELTVPQLRALQDVVGVLTNLAERLPVENKRFVPNAEIDGRPAFCAPFTDVKERRARYVPYEEKDSTRVRTYEEFYDVVLYRTRQVVIDYGLPLKRVEEIKSLVADFQTAIQAAIDDANSKSAGDDPVLNQVIEGVVDVLKKAIKG